MFAVFALQSDVLFSLLKSVGILFLVCFCFYIYYGITLMLIAQQTATKGAGLAWLPIGNLVLMCNIGRRPVWWVLMCFIPILNLLFLTMMWMSIAEVRGKSPFIGALAVIPFLGLLIPAYLALSKGSVPAFANNTASRNCTACGTPIVANESYCRSCGDSAPTMVASGSMRRMPAAQMALIGAGTTLFTFVLFGVFGWFFFLRALSYEPPERQQPDVPERTAGTMTEFPVDTDKDSPTEPGSIIVEDTGQDTNTGNNTGKTEKPRTIPSERLPPGTNRETINKRTSTRTSVVYRRKKKEAQQQQTVPDIVIYVCVLRVLPGQNGFGDSIAVDVVKTSGGTRTGANVQSPQGGIYTGSRISTSQMTVYVLEKQNSDIVILIYSSTSAGNEIATRLATNVGNGEGLNDYPETRATLWTLPQRPPGNLTLVDFQTQTRAEMGLSEKDLKSDDKETQEWLTYINQLIPERATQARYRDSQGRRWEVLILDYESTRYAWNAWTFMNWTVGFGSAGSVTIKDEKAIYADTNDGRILIFQRGPYLICLLSPTSAPVDDLVALGNSVQV